MNLDEARELVRAYGEAAESRDRVAMAEHGMALTFALARPSAAEALRAVRESEAGAWSTAAAVELVARELGVDL